jgi:hypothetical protein
MVLVTYLLIAIGVVVVVCGGWALKILIEAGVN